VVSELGLGELEAVTARWSSSHPLRSVFEVERASLLRVAGHPDSARSVAAEALRLDPLPPERERAEAFESGEIEEEQWRPIIGAILPLSGTLARYGQAAEEGVRLAVEEYNQRHYDQVTLIVRDDRDDWERDGDLVRELEQLGAVAIIGPLRSEGLEEVARRRRDRDLVIVSPTADENYSFARNTYSVWSTTERVTRGARALGAFAVRDLQIDRFGVMYPNTREGRDQLAAFADAVRARGAEVVASIAYDDTATTFQEPMTFLGAANPQAIFAPAGSWSSVIQMAPQFSYYGLRGVQVLGDSDWSEPQVLRLVEPRFVNGTVISTFLDRSSPSVRWPEFVELYERTYRKGLRESMVPALAYDATQLVLEALPWGFPRRSAIARSFRDIRSLPGATGVFSVEDGAITRRPFLLQFKDGELVPAFDELRRGRASLQEGG
jgi:branched-chain amino acid transport system substrate-binding protein